MRSFRKALLLLSFVLFAAATAEAQRYFGDDGKNVKDLKTDLSTHTTFEWYTSFSDKKLDPGMVENHWTIARHEPIDLPAGTEGAKIYLDGGALVGTTVNDAIEAAKAHAADLRLWLEAPDGSRRLASDPLLYKDALLIEEETESESEKRVSLGKRVSVVAKVPSGLVLKTGGAAWELFTTGLIAGAVIGLGLGLVLSANRRQQDLL